jgi:hypothetical protein
MLGHILCIAAAILCVTAIGIGTLTACVIIDGLTHGPEKRQARVDALVYAAAHRSTNENVCICPQPCGQQPCTTRAQRNTPDVSRSGD